MQKLVWQNANGDEINLTGGNYGITEWEGFSNASLNIQNQQVPFQDGAVFLDALIEPRELSVTLKMQDKGNLEERYRMRRELIHRLNPKLGEGYLIYTNDFISKRIKCVPQIPLFETHNSDTRGTPKASLAWTACEPYWEDLEETEVVFSDAEVVTINNEGDVPIGVEIELIGGINPKIYNETTGKKIDYQVTPAAPLMIDTRTGKKKVVLEDFSQEIVIDNINLSSVIYAEEIGVGIAIYQKTVLFTYDAKIWESYNTNQNNYLNSICYAQNKNLFVAVGDNGTIITSNNGKDWTLRTSGVSVNLYGITYSQAKNIFVAVGESGNILTSVDGVVWTSRTSGISEIIKCIAYSETSELFVATVWSQTGVTLRSSDGINWTQGNIGIQYISPNDLIVANGNFVFLDGSLCVESSDGINWNPHLIANEIVAKTIAYSSRYNRYVVIDASRIDASRTVYISSNLVNWESKSIGIDITENINKIIYSNVLRKYIAVGTTINGEKIITSQDGNEWTTIYNYGNSYGIRNIAYSEKIKKYIAPEQVTGYVCVSENGVDWERKAMQNVGGTSGNVYCTIYSKKMEKFVMIKGNNTYISEDGITWENNSGGTGISICYSERLDKYFKKSGFGNIYISDDCSNWTQVGAGNSNGCIKELGGKVIAVGDSGDIRTSIDGINWSTQTSGVTTNLTGLGYSENYGMFVIVGRNGTILTSTNGVNWTKREGNTTDVLYNVIYNKSTGLTFIVGRLGKILKSYNCIIWEDVPTNIQCSLFDGIEPKEDLIVFAGFSGILNLTSKDGTNVIQNLSNDSDIGFNLDIGNNLLRVINMGGEIVAKIKYRQKYIGV